MLRDREIALDCLESAKTGVKELTGALIESSNTNLRQTLTQIRNQTEQDQEEIYHLAERNGWYLPAAQADHQEVSHVNSFFQQFGTYMPSNPVSGQMGYQTIPISNVNQPNLNQPNINQPGTRPGPSQYTSY